MGTQILRRPPQEKKFNGKVYKHIGDFSAKSRAREYAQKLRDKGQKARVIEDYLEFHNPRMKATGTYWIDHVWCVYARGVNR